MASPAAGNEELERYASFQAHQAETVLKAADLALLEAADFVERKPDAKEFEKHSIFRTYVEKTRSLRAVILTDKEGNLKVDSFKFPRHEMNLADRAYVKNSLGSKDRSLYIGKPILGRSSGLSFIPLSRAILDINKNVQGTITGILSPEALIRQDMICGHCFVGVFNKDNELLVSYPSDVSYPADFSTIFNEQPQQYIKEHKAGKHLASSWTITIKGYAMRVILSQIISRND